MNLDELELLAKAATPGPWNADDHGRSVWQPNKKIGGETTLCDIRGWGYLTGKGHGALGLPEDEAIEIQKANANYIAACSPETILALVRVAKAARVMHDSAHNGRLYVKEYDALTEALESLK